MVKTKKVTKATMECCAEPTPYKPSLYLDLSGDDIDIAREVKVGETATFFVRGKVKSISLNERQEDGVKKMDKSGSIRIEDFEVELSTEGEFSALADD